VEKAGENAGSGFFTLAAFTGLLAPSSPRIARVSVRPLLLRLPEPMLARSGAIPSGVGWRFEPKLDGFRCLVCTHGCLRARSRRGWNMAPLLPELEHALPPNVQLDGELVAFDDEGKPDFHRLSQRMLHRRDGIAVTYKVFDVLAFDGESTLREPYRARRQLLEALKFDGVHARVLPVFSDGEALFAAVCEWGLEGVVAKRERDAYRPGDRLWVKTKNRAAPRFADELAGVGRWR
jgi:bifunctional non-homologous end joining protein LigD